MFVFALILTTLSFLSLPGRSLAISDPLSVSNNKLGIHILFPGEIQKAATVVNNDGEGAWGYVVIPIQAKDRDRAKWQKFLDECKENKIIPIIRVATVAEGAHWVIPNYYDLVDFANFLDDLKWPVQNRYIIFFNEVNRADEYGGALSPEDYADTLNSAIDIFKQKSEDFFILPAGLDNAATDRKNSINWKDYLYRMYRRQPELYNKLDGWTSHAYPNPEFSARPDLSGSNKIDSFKFDLAVLKNFTAKKLPVFITESGWSGKYLTDRQIALYYEHAMSKVWIDPSIVTVAPFLLDAQDGPFKTFSFISSDNKLKEFALAFSSFAKVGEPHLANTPIPEVVEPTPAIIEAKQALGAEVNAKDVFQNLYNQFMSLFGLIK